MTFLPILGFGSSLFLFPVDFFFLSFLKPNIFLRSLFWLFFFFCKGNANTLYREIMKNKSFKKDKNYIRLTKN